MFDQLSQPNKSKAIFSTLVLIIANLYPIIGIAFLHWDVLSIGLIYSAEGLIFIAISCIKTLIIGTYFYKHQPETKTKLFFQLFWSYLFITITYLFLLISAYAILYLYFYDFMPSVLAGSQYLNSLQTTSWQMDFRIVSYPILALLLSHLVSFFLNFIGKKEYSKVQKFSLWGIFVSRYLYAFIIILPFTFLFDEITTAQNPNFWISIFICFKIIFDIFRHILEHNR